MRWPVVIALPLFALSVSAAAQTTADVPPPDPAYDEADLPPIAAPPMDTTDRAMGGPAPGLFAQPGDRFGFRNVDNVSDFREPLSAHGRWVNTQWGEAFVPDAPEGWRPYTNGQWGPDRFWQSNDPWGWATDHYGRWGWDANVGSWVWVPDTQWAPSWTAWRENDDVVGWAPVPPGVQYTANVGFGGNWGWNDWNSWYAPSWVWVPRTQVFVQNFGGRVLPWNDGRRYWRRSRWNWNLGLGFGNWGYGGGSNVAINIGNGGWGGGWGNAGWGGGWNSWDPYWGGGFGWNNWGWNNWGGGFGWNNWGWNRPWGWNTWGWHRPWGWNRPGWNRPDYPRRGAPGSVGDRVGRGLYGRLPPPQYGNGGREFYGQPGRDRNPPGWFGRPRRDGDGPFGNSGGNRGGVGEAIGGGLSGRYQGGYPGGMRGDGRRGDGFGGNGFRGNPGGGGFRGPPPGGGGRGIGSSIAGGMGGSMPVAAAPQRMTPPPMAAPRMEAPRMQAPRMEAPRMTVGQRMGSAMSGRAERPQ